MTEPPASPPPPPDEPTRRAVALLRMHREHVHLGIRDGEIAWLELMLHAKHIALSAALEALDQILEERLLSCKVPVGDAAHRGTAADAGIVACLLGASLDAAIDTAVYTGLTVFSADPRRDKERDALPDMVRQGVALLAPWGAPDRLQCEKNWTIDGLAVPAAWEVFGV